MNNYNGVVWSGPSFCLEETIAALLNSACLRDRLSEQKHVVLKPNLVEALEPPITTPVTLIEILVRWLSNHFPQLKIIVADGTGSLEYDTFHCFESLGYMKLASLENVTLVDLNREPSRHMVNRHCSRWPEMYLPEILFNSYLVSVPVLKAHSLSKVTLTMKNMMGCAPPVHFQGNGAWGKSSFHRQIHDAIFDLNRYRTPDFTVLDCSIGMAQAHLWGPTCDPPVGKIVVSYDSVAIDAYGAGLLGKSWQNIEHIRMAHEVLGTADPLIVKEPVLA